MLDDQNMTTWSYCHGGPRQHLPTWPLLWRMQETRSNQIEAPLRERKGEIMRLKPDTVSDLGGGSVTGRDFERYGGDIDRRHMPTLPRQPNCIVAPSASKFQGRASAKRPCELRQSKPGLSR